MDMANANMLERCDPLKTHTHTHTHTHTLDPPGPALGPPSENMYTNLH